MIKYEDFYKTCYEQAQDLTLKEIHDLYLKTDFWLENLRPKALERDFNLCRLCGDKATQVHHIPKFYPEIFGEEKIEHLTSLCSSCHKNFHCPPSVKEVKKQLMHVKDEKMVKCPCCDQQVKLYKRPLNSAMARGLFLINNYFKKSNAEEWLHIESYFKTLTSESPSLRGDFAKLRYWDLIEIKNGTSGAKRQGYYKITDKGKKFANGELSVIQKVHIYNGKVVGFSGKEITIFEAAKNKFSFELI